MRREDVLLLTPRSIGQRRSHPVVTLIRQLAKPQERNLGEAATGSNKRSQLLVAFVNRLILILTLYFMYWVLIFIRLVVNFNSCFISLFHCIGLSRYIAITNLPILAVFVEYPSILNRFTPNLQA